jgi:fumarate hydratase subunit beta
MNAQPIHLYPPLTTEDVASLHAGDPVRIDGTIYVARDAAHKRMVEALAVGQDLPFDPEGQVLYYMGPSPARPGRPIGAAGPTTSYRMDPYTEPMIRAGVKAVIGKGGRGPEVKRALREYGAIYLVAVGGAGALLAGTIRRAQVIAYPDLGPEAVRMLEVEGFPAVVGYDTYGEDIYEIGRTRYRDAAIG